MTGEDRARFSLLCLAEEEDREPRSIGTYAEKRLHRILKAFVSEKKEEWEIPVGKYVADVVSDGRITEIQTGSLRPLVRKLSYYLEETDYSVTLLLPVIGEKRIFRIDPRTGEILRSRLSPKREGVSDLLPELYWIGKWFAHPRLSIHIPEIRAEEHRFSERMRYRKAGAYDSELYPKELLSDTVLTHPSDLAALLPEVDSFRASEYGRFSGLEGRRLSAALGFLCQIGLLEKEKDGRAVFYRKTKQSAP